MCDNKADDEQFFNFNITTTYSIEATLKTMLEFMISQIT